MSSKPHGRPNQGQGSLTALPARAREPVLHLHLPTPLASLVDRERETAALRDLFTAGGVRLLTLSGPGGVGKTTVALWGADGLRDRFGDGIGFVMLASVANPRLVLPTIARTLAVRETGDGALAERLAAVLGDRHVLLVLDNFEHLLPAAPALTDLLGACPRLHLLVTSRTRLGLSGEQELPIPPLALPDATAPAGGAEIARSPAVALFVARARAIRPDFALTAATAADVAEICRRLDGLPLAIELAAARIGHLPPPAILARLDRRLPLLTGGARDQPARLRTMRDAIAWSHDLLAPEEQALFRRLAVLSDGFTLEGGEAVGGRGGGDDDPSPSPPLPLSASVLDGIASLVEKNVVQHTAGPDGEPRFRMLETIREFGLERLEASGEAEAIRRRHAGYLIAFGEASAAPLTWPAEAEAIERLAAELDNVRAALAWARERGEFELILRLVVATYTLWYLRASPGEGSDWLEAALAESDRVAPSLRAQALFCGSGLASVRGDHHRAAALAEESLAVSRAHGYPVGIASALLCLGLTAEWQGDLGRAGAHYDEALRLMRAADEPYWAALFLSNLADITLWQGDRARAAALAEEGLTRWRSLGHTWGITLALGTAAAVAAEQGDLASASTRYEEALASYMALGDRRGIAGTLAGIAGVVGAGGYDAQAARLLGAARALGDAAGITHLAHHVQYERVLAATRARLDERAFAAAWEAGRELPTEQAIAEAIGGIEPASASPRKPGRPRAPGSHHRLTAREREVLRLLAAGHSDREIAAVLSISVRTASNHVTNILGKLGASSRTAAAVAALERGLL